MVKYVSAYQGYTSKKISAKNLFDDVYPIFFLIFFTKAYVVSTHLNCIDKWMQFRWVPTIYAFIKMWRNSILEMIFLICVSFSVF